MGTADFNNDGRADVLVRRANGTWLLYVLDSDGGSTLHKPKIARSQKFTVQALADFDGDGFTDVLVRHAGGKWLLYLLDGAKVRRKGDPGISADTDFTLQSHADFNGDGKADALLRHTDGGWMLYALDGDGPAVIASGIPEADGRTRAGCRRAIESRDARNQLNVAALCAASGPC